MATVKSLIQSFCYRINQPAPTAFAGQTTPTEAQYLEILRFIGDNLRNRPFNWPQLKRAYSFTTVQNQSKYQLPGDFYRMLDSSQWDTTSHFRMFGPASDAFFAARQFAAINVVTQRVFHIVGPTGYLYSTAPYSQRSAGSFEITPAAPNSTDVLAFAYLSCNWVQPIDWIASTAYTAGQVRSVDGYVYICTANGTSGTTRPSTGTANTNITDGTVTWRVYTEPYPCSLANSLLTDNDLVLFDEDIMIEGMAWRYKQLKGLDYQDLRQEWEDNLQMMNGRFKGISRSSLAFSDGDLIDEWPRTSEGSWNV